MKSLGMLAGGLLMMLIVIATAFVIARSSKFYRRELSEAGNRELALDGLRGLAALMVATYHAAICHSWIVTGKWENAQSPVLQLFGSGGVIIFFMLTGYLFWSKARKGNGRIKAWKLWRGRLYRIAPLYLFSLLLVLLVAVADLGGSWLAPGHWHPLLRLFALGAFNWDNVGTIDLNDYNGVVWTLSYEWEFYLILPFIAWLAIGKRIWGIAGLVYFIFLCPWVLFYISPRLDWTDLNFQFWLFFILGMLCPAFLENETLRSWLSRPRAAVLALLLTISWCSLNPDFWFSVSLAVGLFPIFFVVAAGNSFFGILIHPAIRCLGAMSFSLYLLHSIFFRLVFRLLKTAGWTELPELYYWTIIFGTAIAITLLCAATYCWIEFPFLSISHKKNHLVALK